ncbi:MAG: PPC domain-containing protein, partial [Sulfurovum sp.]|nr:PPC domain-containing protein [Sulfurovum sp.]
DNDYFKIVVPTAGTLTVYTSGQTDTEGFLYDAKNHRVASDDNSLDHNFKISKFIAAGTYYVRVRHHNKLLVGSYELVSFFIPNDHNSILGDAIPISPNSRISGSIEIPRDVDYFRIAIPHGGGMLTVYTTGQTDTYGSLLDANGHRITFNDNMSSSDNNFKILRGVAAGIYYVEVKHHSTSSIGSYALVSHFIPDDHGYNINTATPIGLNSTTPGSIEVKRDEDWFKIAIPHGGGMLTVYTTGQTDTYGSLLDANGHRITFNDNMSSSDNNFKILRGVAAGIYYVRVKHSSTFSTGRYSLISHFVPDDYGNSKSEAATISLNSTTPGSIEIPRDKDYFKIQIPAAGTLVINTTGSTDTVGTLLDASGNKIVRNDNANGSLGSNFKISKGVTAGTYYVEVKHYRSVSTGHYTLVSRFILDHTNSKTTAISIDLNSTTQDRIEVAGDEDWFKIVIPRRGTLTVSTTGSTDTEGFLYDTHGTQLVYDNNHGTDNNFRISKFITAGVYYVKVRHHRSVSTGSYSLITRFIAGETSQAQVLDDHGGSKNTATPIDLNSTTLGSIETFGDIDYFKIVIPRGSVGRLTVYTTGSGDTVGTLYNPSSARPVSDDNSGTDRNFRISQIVTAGTYYIKVKYYFASKIGSYSLVTRFTLQADVSDDHGNTKETATLIDPNSTTSGSIDKAGDNDWFKIIIPSEGGVLTVHTTGSGDTVGELLDTNGTRLVFNDDVSDTDNNFKISKFVTAGTYYVRVRNYNNQVAGNGYTLISQFAPRQDDDRSTAISINPNSTTRGRFEVTGDRDWLTITRDVDWFKIEIPSGGGALTVRATNTISITRSLTAGTYYVRVSASSAAGSSGKIYYLGRTFYVQVHASLTDSYTFFSRFIPN